MPELQKMVPCRLQLWTQQVLGSPMSWSFESPVGSPVAAALSLVSFSAMSILKMIFLFPGSDMLLSWRVYIIYFFGGVPQ